MAQVFVIGVGMVDMPAASAAPSFDTTTLTGPQMAKVDHALSDAGTDAAAKAQALLRGSQPAGKA